MALITTRKAQLTTEEATWFDVTIENSSVSVLHSSAGWTGHGDTPFSLKSSNGERHSIVVEDTYQCVFFYPVRMDTITLVMCDQEVVLTEE
jgi:hypothetical protein